MSFTGSGKCLAASSENFLESSRKICQSLLDSQQGGTAADKGWMKLCKSVEFRSFFSYHVAAGRTMSEYKAEVSMRKFKSTTRSIFPCGAVSCHTTSLTEPLAMSSAMALVCVPR